MRDIEIARLQKYLRAKFDNNRIKLAKRPKTDDSVEVLLDDEFLAVVYRDDDEGEISYQIHMCVIEEDLPEI
ncbi:DUF3126 family protein [Eilatimonas milleporae]|uniref:Uncharacterized protein DUF3126 n=1 Tax=Eilatimonas milleporae TaxID=911205 RepID=A0A3M0C398_9PROT|nr:DUF3126 family protein [Eilatimonas milleporae]RMB02870.1 uncharacterized protein DUF3126 [Eilatimonas milleporae]